MAVLPRAAKRSPGTRIGALPKAPGSLLSSTRPVAVCSSDRRRARRRAREWNALHGLVGHESTRPRERVRKVFAHRRDGMARHQLDVHAALVPDLDRHLPAVPPQLIVAHLQPQVRSRRVDGHGGRAMTSREDRFGREGFGALHCGSWHRSAQPNEVWHCIVVGVGRER
eukprot:7382501-Prymnesium_polylepis.2